MYFYDQPLHQLIKTNINNMIYQHQLIVNLYVHNLFEKLDQSVFYHVDIDLLIHNSAPFRYK